MMHWYFDPLVILSEYMPRPQSFPEGAPLFSIIHRRYAPLGHVVAVQVAPPTVLGSQLEIYRYVDPSSFLNFGSKGITAPAMFALIKALTVVLVGLK